MRGVPLDLEELVAEALGEREGDIRAISPASSTSSYGDWPAS
jgi:hypothetical protein